MKIENLPSPSHERTIMNAVEAADFLRVSESMIRKLASGKQIPHFRLGGRYLFYRGALEKWATDLTIPVETRSPEGEAQTKANEIWKASQGGKSNGSSKKKDDQKRSGL